MRQTRTAAAALLPDDDALRRLYRVLRQREKMEYTEDILSAESGLPKSQVRCGMRIFAELALIRWQEAPLSYQMVPSGRVSLQNSPLRGRLMAIRSGM